jgi:hypothetical protein
MADSKAKQILDAMAGLLGAIEGAVTVKINAPLPEEVPDDGLIILREGKVVSSDETLGGFDSAYVSQVFPVEVYVSDGDDATRDAKYDAVLQEIGRRLYADRRLGGLAYWLVVERPEPVSQAILGAAAEKAATIDVTIDYESGSDSPLG